MSRYSSESSSDYISGNEPRHRRRIKIYDRDGNVIKDSVREFAGTQTHGERRKSSVDSEGRPQVLETRNKSSTDTKEPLRQSGHHSPNREEGQRRPSQGLSGEKDEHQKSSSGKEKVKNSEPLQQQRHSFERRRRSLDREKGKHEEKRRSSFESDKQNGQEERLGSNDKAISGPPDKRRTSKEEEEARRNSVGEKSKEDGDQCVIPSDNPHHIHHHRVHHHRHYKKFNPHSSVDDPEGCQRLPDPESKTGEEKAHGGEDDKNRNSQRPPVTDHTTSVSRVFRPKMNDRDVAINVSPVSSGSNSLEFIKPRTTRTARFGRLVDMNDPDETDEGSFLYNDVPLPDSSEKKIAQASNAAVEGSDCPFCGQGKFRRKFTWTGVMASILLFPCGIYCCFKYRVQVCTYCGISPL